ncbi:MAG: hypothetical protein AABZ06_01105, partial [Bdellovibrionota bacterium]
MILRQPISEALWRLTVRMTMAANFARCGLKRESTKIFHAMVEAPGYCTTHAVSLDVTPPGRTERIRFSGVDIDSAKVAARKAFCEYLEAITLWDSGASEEVSRSGWACAMTENSAQDTAYRELIERDAFIAHFLCPELRSTPIPSLADFKLVRLQSVDPEMKVIYCGLFLPDLKRWLIGGACERDEAAAIRKALLEVVMMRKDWTATPRGNHSPKHQALLPHWESPENPKVMANIFSLFAGGGTRAIDFSIDRNHARPKAIRRFSKTHVVVGCEHPDLAALTFGELWLRSEDKIRQVLKRRGLEIHEWL